MIFVPLDYAVDIDVGGSNFNEVLANDIFSAKSSYSSGSVDDARRFSPSNDVELPLSSAPPV
jgi:hypothetical protein